MSALKVGAAQIECRPGDLPANLALHLAVIDEARTKGIDILVFPELSLTDYLSNPDVLALALSLSAPPLRQLAEAAGPMAVAVGFIEEADGARFYNAQAILRDGMLVHVHRKANLASYGRLEEGKHYAAGRRVAMASLGEPWITATLICADIWNPALPWLAALQGASLLLVPAASSLDAVAAEFDNPEGWTVNLRQISLTYGLPLVMANHCGSRGGLRFWGGSCVFDALGREIARAGAEPALLAAEFDYRDVRLARVRLPTARDAHPELVHRELQRMLGGPGADRP
jgi:predicted amidohydrolase